MEADRAVDGSVARRPARDYNSGMVKKERILFINVLRVLAFAAVFYYHALMENSAAGFLPADLALRLTEGANLHLAKTAVALFFMLSGASLMYAYREDFAAGAFFKKRVTRILVPYWIASFVIFAGYFHFRVEGSPLKLLYNLFALDGYAKTIGLPAMYFTIGEWFLGCLMPMYLLFPLLRRLMIKYPAAVLWCATAVYNILAVWYPFSVIPHANFFLKFYEFILGMYLAFRAERPKKGLAVFYALLFAGLLFAPKIPIPEGLVTTLSAFLIYECFAALEGIFRKMPRFMSAVNVCCRYAFEVYLVHHVALLMVFRHVYTPESPAGTVLLFVLQLLCSILAGVMLYYVSQTVLRLGGRIFERRGKDRGKA